MLLFKIADNNTSTKYIKYIKHQSNHKNNQHRSVKRYSNQQIVQTIKKEFHTVFGETKSLCSIGARCKAEITFLKNLAAKVTGVDLFTDEKCPEIIKCDMHEVGTRFSENEFDVVYSCHSLEHSARPKELLKGIKKISQRGAFIIVPPTAKTGSAPTVGHPFWVWCFKETRFNIKNLQEFIDELVGDDFGTVVKCCKIDENNLCFSIVW